MMIKDADSANLTRKLKCVAFFTMCLIVTACERYSDPASSLEVASKGVHSSSISPDGKLAAIGSIRHGGSLWNLEQNARIFNWNHKAGEQSVITQTAFSLDGLYALTANSFEITLWDTYTGKGLRFWTAPGEILDARLDRQGRFALLGLSDHSAVLFDIQKGGIKRTLRHNNRVRAVDISDNGRWALTGSEDYFARFWDLASGELIHTVEHQDDVQMVTLSGDGSIALSVSKYDKAMLWNTKTAEPIGQLPLKSERLRRGLQLTAASFNSNASLLLTGRPDEVVQLWSTTTLDLIHQWKLPKRSAWKPTGASVTSLRFIDDNHFIAISSNGFVHRLTLP